MRVSRPIFWRQLFDVKTVTSGGGTWLFQPSEQRKYAAAGIQLRIESSIVSIGFVCLFYVLFLVLTLHFMRYKCVWLKDFILGSFLM